MCEIAPFQMKCELEENSSKLMSCAVHKLYCAGTELMQSIPVFGNYVNDYRCGDFMPHKEVLIKELPVHHGDMAATTREAAMKALGVDIWKGEKND